MVPGPVTGHKYWDAVVVVTAPVIDLFDGIATGEDGAGPFDFIQKLASNTRRINGLRRWCSVRSKPIPLVEPDEVVAAGVARFVVGASDVTVK
jgi:hypothetical protein